MDVVGSILSLVFLGSVLGKFIGELVGLFMGGIGGHFGLQLLIAGVRLRAAEWSSVVTRGRGR